MAQLPNRWNSGGDDAGGTPKAAVVAIAVVTAVLAAFAIGVLVGKTRDTVPDAAVDVEPTDTDETGNAPMDNGVPETTAQAEGVQIDMVRPDGTPGPTFAAPAPVPPPSAPPATTTPAPEPAATKAGESRDTAVPGPPVKSAARKDPSKTQPKGIYTVQVAAFRDNDAAQRLALQLESRGYDAYVQRSNVDGKGIWYRVRVGSFETKESAKELARRIESKEGRSAYVTIR